MGPSTSSGTCSCDSAVIVLCSGSGVMSVLWCGSGVEVMWCGVLVAWCDGGALVLWCGGGGVEVVVLCQYYGVAVVWRWCDSSLVWW